MIHCRHCGTTNDLARSTCRACGGTLAVERGTRPCPACQELTGDGTAFCHACGAVVLGAADALHDESIGIPGWAAADPLTNGNAEAAPGATVDADPLGIGDDLELPDWLLRAANETPPATTGTAPTTTATGSDVAFDLGPGFVVAGRQPEPASPVDRAPSFDPGDDLVVEPAMIATPLAPPRPIPLGNLAEAMPSWLRAAPEPVAEDLVVEPVVATDPPGDPTNTQSFIGESDLPEWLRQLATAAAAKAAAERVAADDVRAAATAPEAVQPAHAAVLAQSDRTATAATGGWLSRAATAPTPDGIAGAGPSGGPGASRGSAFAEVVARDAAPSNHVPAGGRAGTASAKRESTPAATRRAMPDRRVLLALVAVAVAVAVAAVVVVLLVLTGAFG